MRATVYMKDKVNVELEDVEGGQPASDGWFVLVLKDKTTKFFNRDQVDFIDIEPDFSDRMQFQKPTIVTPNG